MSKIQDFLKEQDRLHRIGCFIVKTLEKNNFFKGNCPHELSFSHFDETIQVAKVMTPDESLPSWTISLTASAWWGDSEHYDHFAAPIEWFENDDLTKEQIMKYANVITAKIEAEEKAKKDTEAKAKEEQRIASDLAQLAKLKAEYPNHA